MIFNIDLDRGVHSRTDPGSGAEVYMYVDEPGVYRSAHGTEVDAELARRSGFPVDEHLKKRRYNEALRNAQEKVIAELAEANAGEKLTVKEREGFKVVDIGYDRYQVYSPDAELMTSKHLSLREAVILLDQLAPPGPEEEKKV